jgi:aspartate carbamoyltransferase catalytic subunit
MIKHFLSLASFPATDLLALLDKSLFFLKHQNHPEKINHLLRHKIFANVFYEPSTRTRCSFEIAAKRLGAEVINFVPENSSVKKGETVYDTLKTLESLGVDGIVFRHSDDNVFYDIQDRLSLPLINAGAGKQEHPSQCLLDLFTLQQEFGRLEGLQIAICGDVRHSRVASSMIVAAEKFGMEIYLCGPEELLPESRKTFVRNAEFDDILNDVDAVMMLRVQLERHEGLELSPQTYHHKWGLTSERVERMNERAIILHPGPFNRGVEIANDVVEHERSRIFKQMSNGVFTRMAILDWAVNRRMNEEN